MTSGRVCAPHQLGSVGSEVLLPGKGKTQHNKASIQLEADTSPRPLSASRDSDQQTKKGVTVLLGLLMLIAVESEVSGTHGDGRGCLESSWEDSLETLSVFPCLLMVMNRQSNTLLLV